MDRNLSNGMRNRSRYRSLNKEERLFLCELVRGLVPVARDGSHSMRKIARGQISLMMWRWTADGVCLRSNVARQDAIKYDVSLLPATAKACEIALVTDRGLRHEHVVPRIRLADRIIEENMAVPEMYRFLLRHCAAVMVTKEEDLFLSKKTMPPNWEWDKSCIYQRYRDAQLYGEIKWAPESPPPFSA
jgi:hypothetical protein